MARDKKDAWSRFREKENEREENLKEELNKAIGETPDPNKIKDGQKATREMPGAQEQNPLIRLIQRASMQMEQIQHLYNMYVAGVEKTPPNIQRKQLEEMYVKIMGAPKNNQVLLFRCNQFVTKYLTYRDRWERLMKDIESGKVVLRKPEKEKNRF